MKRIRENRPFIDTAFRMSYAEAKTGAHWKGKSLLDSNIPGLPTTADLKISGGLHRGNIKLFDETPPAVVVHDKTSHLKIIGYGLEYFFKVVDTSTSGTSSSGTLGSIATEVVNKLIKIFPGPRKVKMAETNTGRQLYFKPLTQEDINIYGILIAAGVSVEIPNYPLSAQDNSSKTEATLALFLPDGMEISNLDSLVTNQEERISVFEDLGREIAKMHKAGISHRDLHYKNIIIDPRSLKVVLIDFESSKSAEIVPWPDQINGREYKTFRSDLQNMFFSLMDSSNSVLKSKEEAIALLDAVVNGYDLEPEASAKVLSDYYEAIFSEGYLGTLFDRLPD